MYLARVIGTVVASQKEPTIQGLKLLLVKQCGLDGQADESGATLVAADAIGAGVGEVVLYASGSSARQTKVTDKRPVDAVVMAIVDQVAVRGDATYTKFESE